MRAAARARPGLLAALLPLLLIALDGCRHHGAAPSRRPLRIATYSGPLSLDPHEKNEAATFSLLSNVYDTLVAFDAQLRVKPALAASWENPNDLTWRFRIRPGVHFHDGRLLTADDVVASLERVRHHPRSGAANYLVTVDKVRKLDDATVEITTLRPSPVLLNKLTFVFIVPRDAPEEIRQPIGTGPYRLLSATDKAVRFAAYGQSWHGAAPEPDVEFLVVPDALQRVEMLERGEVDVVQEVEPDLAARVEKAAGCRLLASEGLSVEYLHVRVDAPPFSDLRVRQALMVALDRDALVRDHLRGHGLPIAQMVGRQVFGYAPDLQPPRRDVARARQLLAAAGVQPGFAIDLEFRAGRGANEVARQLADVGLLVRPVPRPWGEMYKRLQEGKVLFYLGAYLAGSADASDVFDSKVHSRGAMGYGDTNYNGFSDPVLDRMIDDSATTMDMLQRRAQLQAVMRRLMESLPLVPLYSPYPLYGVRDDVQWEPRRDSQMRAVEISRRPQGAAS
jgi:peptide/nickel transport system substrate-binding protein